MGGTGIWPGSISGPAAAARCARRASRSARTLGSCWSGRSSTRPGSACRWRRGRSSSAGGVRSSRCCAHSAMAPGCWFTAWGRLASRAWRRGCSAGCRHRPVLIFERYDALAIFDEVLGALTAGATADGAVGLARDGEGRSGVPGRGVGELADRAARCQPDPADRGRPGAHSRDPDADRYRGRR